jgi:integrase
VAQDKLKTATMDHITYYPARYVQGKRNYVIFYYNVGGKMQSFKKHFDRIRSEKHRNRQANEYVSIINRKLSEGWNPLSTDALLNGCDLMDAIRNMLEVKSVYARSRTMDTYRSRLMVFESALRLHLGENVRCCDLGPRQAAEILDRITIMRQLGARTRNNYLIDLKTWFNDLVSKGFFATNPFAGIKPMPETEPENIVFTDSELRALIEWTRANNYWYFVTCGLCYYGALRPAEIVRLRVADFDFPGSAVTISGNKSKNKKTRIIPLPTDFMVELSEKLGATPNHWHIIGRGLRPGNISEWPQRISDYFRNEIRPALGFHDRLIFYGLKDTAVARILDHGGDIVDARDFCRHDNVSTTNSYYKRSQAPNRKIHEYLPPL